MSNSISTAVKRLEKENMVLKRKLAEAIKTIKYGKRT